MFKPPGLITPRGGSPNCSTSVKPWVVFFCFLYKYNNVFKVYKYFFLYIKGSKNLSKFINALHNAITQRPLPMAS